MLEFVNGYKTYIAAGFMALIAVAKILTDIEEIESVAILGISNPWDLLASAYAVIAGRSALKKLEPGS